MEHILMSLRASVSKLSLLLEEMGRFVVAGEDLLAQVASAAAGEKEFCLASATHPSIAEMVRGLHLLYNMFRRELVANRQALGEISKYKISQTYAASDPKLLRDRVNEIFNSCFGNVPNVVEPSLLSDLKKK